MKPMKRTFDEEDYELENVYNEDDERYLMANSSIWYS
jgi:hypothetical protein